VANTPNGLPYPVGTDLVVNGDDAIRALAETVDPKTGTPAGATFTPDASLWAPDGTIASVLTRAGGRWLLTAFVRNKNTGAYAAGVAVLGSVSANARVATGPTTVRTAGVISLAAANPLVVGVQLNVITGALQVLFPNAIASIAAGQLGLGWEITWDAA
jgi:hypothetical protein